MTHTNHAHSLSDYETAEAAYAQYLSNLYSPAEAVYDHEQATWDAMALEIERDANEARYEIDLSEADDFECECEICTGQDTL